MDRDSIKSNVLPQFFPADWIPENPIVHSDFPSRIRIGYVTRVKGGYSYIMNHDCDAMNLTLDELHFCAIKNLGGLPSARATIAETPGGAEVIITADDNFVAVRILLPKVRSFLASKLGAE